MLFETAPINILGGFLFLKRLEISGFKSFAAKSVLDFEKGEPVAIVGPNGSGKSNCADAVRWVLGEQSYKSVRAKKSEDVIFSGSGAKAKASMARVSMILDNADRKAPIDFSEVEISRAIYRDGSGEYLLNGKKARLLDVAELLAKSGFGQSTYSVIGQGMVDSMLFYGPAERKVLFDEAAGVRQYEIKREQTIRKLEGTTGNIVRIRDILAELNPRLSTLKRQAEKAAEKDTLKANLLEKQKIYFSSIWDRITVSEKDTRGDLEKISAEETKLQTELAELNRAFNEILKGEKSQGTETIDFQKDISDLESQKDEHRQKIFTLRAKMEVGGGELTKKEIAEKIKAITSKIDALEDKVLQKQKSELEKDLKGMQSEQEDINHAMAEKRDQITELTSSLNKFDFGVVGEKLSAILYLQNDFMIKIEAAKNIREVGLAAGIGKKVAERLKELRKQVGEAKEGKISQVADVQRELEKKLSEKEKVAEKISDANGQIWKLEFEIKKIDGERFELEKELGYLKTLNPNESSEKKKFEKEISETETEIAKIEAEIQKIREKINKESHDFESQGKKLSEIKDKLADKQRVLSEYSNEVANLRVELAKSDTKKQDLREEIGRELGSEALLADAKIVPELDEQKAREEIEKLKGKLYAIGEIDSEVKTEYEEVGARVNFLSTQLSDLETAKNDLEKLISDLDGRIKKQFESSFSAISTKFSHFFDLLFGGGTASLDLVRQKDEEEGEEQFGIEITAVPPGKRVKSLSALSGGERTLTSLALLFAILSVNPAPFCVLDEVDAALDEANTKKFLKIVSELAKTTQFIFITHNRETMKTAGLIYGITIDNTQASKLLSIKLADALKNEKTLKKVPVPV